MVFSGSFDVTQLSTVVSRFRASFHGVIRLYSGKAARPTELFNSCNDKDAPRDWQRMYVVSTRGLSDSCYYNFCGEGGCGQLRAEILMNY